MDSSWNSLKGPTRSFDYDCSNDKNISLAPKRSIETNFSKESFFHGDKCFWPTFPCIIECEKHQGTFYKGPQIFLTFTLELVRACFFDINGCWKHKVSKQKQSFQWSKVSGLYFLVLSNMKNVMEHIVWVHKLCWQKFCKWSVNFFGTWGVDRNKHFKESCFHDDKSFWPIFLLLLLVKNLKVHFLRVHKLIWQTLWNL